MTIKEYAKKILVDAGCDEYTYGGEYSKHILDDLKEEFPNGMEFPYVDVANAILEMSRPRPIYRAPWKVIYDTEDSCDSVNANSFEEANETAIEILVNWVNEELDHYPVDFEEWSEEQIENWDHFIYYSSVALAEYNPMTDEYDDCDWEPSYEDAKATGWLLYEDFVDEHKENLKDELLKRGLHEDRLQQMLKSWHDDIEQVYTVVEDWGVELCNKGYDIFNYDGLGLLEIEAISDVDAFDDDEAVNHAIADGVKIIPVEELPEKFDKKFLGWIDTPENRRNILEYVDKYCR